jgi:hypothetical protein
MYKEVKISANIITENAKDWGNIEVGVLTSTALSPRATGRSLGGSLLT